MEFANTTGTAKVLDSNLTGPVFFSNWKYSVTKNSGLNIRLLMFCRLSCRIVDFFCLLYAFFLIVALSVLIYCAVCSFLNSCFLCFFFALNLLLPK